MRRWHWFPLLACAWSGCAQQTAIPAPKALVPFEAPDKAFKGLKPEGWREVAGASMGIMSGVSFTKYDARIGITADLAGSLQADIARAGSAPTGSLEAMMPEGERSQPLPTVRPPVEQLHVAHQGRASKGLVEYEEQRMQPLQSRLGEGRVSEFTGAVKAPFGSSKVHGFRVTILSGDREVTVVARCWDSDWATLKPTFSRVIDSLDSAP